MGFLAFLYPQARSSLLFHYVKFHLGANFNAQIKEDFYWNLEGILFFKGLLEPNLEALSQGLGDETSQNCSS